MILTKFRVANSLALTGLLTVSAAFGQTPQPTPTPARPLENPVAETPSGAPSAAGAQKNVAALQQDAPTRQQRARAYAKILEGQRFLASLRSNPESGGDLLEQARLSFREATQLDPQQAEAHTALAQIAFDYAPQNLLLAEREAQLAVKIDPDNYGSRKVLSRLYTLNSGLRTRRLVEEYTTKAISETKELVRVAPSEAEGWALLGELYYATGKKKEAVEALTRWTAVPPSNEGRFFSYVTGGRRLSPDAANARLGEVLLEIGRPQEAMTAIQRAMSIEPDEEAYSALYARALTAMTGDANNPQSLANLEAAFNANPGNGELARLLAANYVKQGKTEAAAGVLQRALGRMKPTDRQAMLLRLNLAQIYTDAGRTDDAIAAYEMLLTERGLGDKPAISEDEQEFSGRVLATIFDLQKNAGRADAAKVTLDRMRRVLGTEDPTPDLRYIELLRAQNKPTEALTVIRAARNRYPNESSLLRLEAITLADAGHVDEGVALLHARLGGTLEDYDELLTMATIYTRANRHKEAVAAARQALALVPAGTKELRIDALLTLASVQESANDKPGAEASLKSVLELDADNASALNNYGYFLLERDDAARYQEALEMIQRAVRAEPDSSSYLDSLGWAYYKLGKYDEAEKQTRAALRRDAFSATLNEHLGDILNKQGKTADAQAAWQKALTLTTEKDVTARLKNKLGGKKPKGK